MYGIFLNLLILCLWIVANGLVACFGMVGYLVLVDACRFSAFAKLSERKGFRGAEHADFKGSLQLLTSSHLRERDKMLLRAIVCGGVVYFHTLLLQHFGEMPEFASLMSLDRNNWPCCLLWHG